MHPKNKKGINGILDFLSIFFNKYGANKIIAADQKLIKNAIIEKK